MEKQHFDDAIGAAPPSTVDVDAVIARQRRAAWTRRAVGQGGAAAAGVVAVTFGVVAALPAGSGDTPTGAGPGVLVQATTSVPTSTSSAPTGPPSPCTEGTPTAPPAPEQPATAAARLRSVLTAAVQRQLPGSELVANPVSRYGGRSYGPLEFFHVLEQGVDLGNGSCKVPADYFLARANVSDAAGTGNISAMVARLSRTGGPSTTCPEPGVAPEQSACDQHAGPNGEIIVASTLHLEGGPTVHRVEVTKTDGTGLILMAENVANDGKEGGPPQRATPPLTHEQLIAIALDLGMTLYPPH